MDDPFPSHLIVKAASESKSITQDRLARMVGVTPTSMSRYFRGRRDLPFAKVVQVALVLNLRLDTIAGVRT